MTNKKFKIVVAYGTRPEIIKLAPLIIELRKRRNVELVVVNSGQHKEMVDDLELFFGIRSHYRFEVMTPNQSLNTILSKIVNETSRLFSKIKPDLVFVQGDTTTVFAIATACFYSGIKTAHVEAGLRSGDIYNPYPEEFNRRSVSLISNYNFAPTKASANNLIKEKVPRSKIYITGNTVVDALNIVLAKQKQKPGSSGLTKRILITAHRRENHGKGIENICNAVKKILSTRNDIEFIWPVHPNPNVVGPVKKILRDSDRVTISAPLSYIELVAEMNKAYLIWTDSGGIQEEAPSLKKPVLILRTVTERPEVITSGFGILVGTDIKKIVSITNRMLDSKSVYKKMVSGKNPFGDGRAAKKIVDIILR
ncbi:MAG: UDP-N-acetylglucosamine 2-epimerase (non-hydrolyzing) [Bacteroidia bacterium]|nr:UDP-N-acetylglucosamine 2-epimerase (non-hydrolyzing) [Bacteroidia bacterium]